MALSVRPSHWHTFEISTHLQIKRRPNLMKILIIALPWPDQFLVTHHWISVMSWSLIGWTVSTHVQTTMNGFTWNLVCELITELLPFSCIWLVDHNGLNRNLIGELFMELPGPGKLLITLDRLLASDHSNSFHVFADKPLTGLTSTLVMYSYCGVPQSWSTFNCSADFPTFRRFWLVEQFPRIYKHTTDRLQ